MNTSPGRIDKKYVDILAKDALAENPNTMSTIVSQHTEIDASLLYQNLFENIPKANRDSLDSTIDSDQWLDDCIQMVEELEKIESKLFEAKHVPHTTPASSVKFLEPQTTMKRYGSLNEVNKVSKTRYSSVFNLASTKTFIEPQAPAPKPLIPIVEFLPPPLEIESNAVYTLTADQLHEFNKIKGDLIARIESFDLSMNDEINLTKLCERFKSSFGRMKSIFDAVEQIKLNADSKSNDRFPVDDELCTLMNKFLEVCEEFNKNVQKFN